MSRAYFRKQYFLSRLLTSSWVRQLPLKYTRRTKTRKVRLAKSTNKKLRTLFHSNPHIKKRLKTLRNYGYLSGYTRRKSFRGVVIRRKRLNGRYPKASPYDNYFKK